MAYDIVCIFMCIFLIGVLSAHIEQFIVFLYTEFYVQEETI